MASNVPKFTSFRPKPKPPAEPSKHAEPERADRPRSARQHRKPEKASKPLKETDLISSDKHARTVEKEDPASYIVDRKGDISNLTYGGLNRWNVPVYRRSGYGCVMGVFGQKIDRDRTTDQELVLTPVIGRRPERLLTSKHVGKDSGRLLRFIKATGASNSIGDLDYIAFPAVKRKHDDDESHDIDYRSIEGKSGLIEPPDPDVVFESDTELVDESAAVTLRNSVLTRNIHDHPDTVQAWIDLIDHEEDMLTMGRSSVVLSTSEKRHLADIRVSIYEQALRKIGSDRNNQTKLYAGLMAEASLSWDAAKLASKWIEILSGFPENLALWTQYIDFVETSFVDFKYETCRTTFNDCLKALKSSKDTISPDSYLYIIVRLTVMIQQAGYQELALALWQAILEFHLLSPAATNTRNEPLSLFEEFWDSEVARIGEPDAKGWRNYDGYDALSPVIGPPVLETPVFSQPTLTGFHKSETEHMAMLRYPGRTTDEIGEDDPFHLILFSDIRPLLEVIPHHTPSLSILGAFLSFCRLPPFPRIDSHQQTWWMDPFLRHGSAGTSVVSDQLASFNQTLLSYCNCPISYFQITTELLFDRAFPDDAGPIELAFIRRVLKLVIADSSIDDVVGEYLIAFEFKYFPREAFKTAKQILKTRPSSLRLYNAYGLFESRRGNSDKADQVFSAALSMQKDAVPFATPGSLQLFHSWVCEALGRGDMIEALWRLLYPKGEVPKRSDGDPATPDQTALLRARTTFTEANERALLGREYVTAVVCTSLAAILAYLSSDQQPESVLSVHDKLLSWFNERNLSQSSEAELHAQSIAHFLTLHVTNASIVRPSLIRTVLEPLITLFPSNTILLALYAANEARFSVDDRVRGIMSQQVLKRGKGASFAAWFFAIHFERLRGEVRGSTSHSVRALFKQAEADVGAQSVALWQHHVLFELEEARKERELRPAKKPKRDGKKRKEEILVEESYRRVRDTFFEGLTHLPWCKEYMMLAFTHLREVLEKEDLKRVYNVMVEKELRIYVDLDTSTMGD